MPRQIIALAAGAVFFGAAFVGAAASKVDAPKWDAFEVAFAMPTPQEEAQLRAFHQAIESTYGQDLGCDCGALEDPTMKLASR